MVFICLFVLSFEYFVVDVISFSTYSVVIVFDSQLVLDRLPLF